MRPARLVVLGRPGAGKGTQCQRLARHYQLPHVSTGEMLRALAGTDVGRRARDSIDAGDLLADDVMVEMVAERLGHDDVRRVGFLLDGFPRTLPQAEALPGLIEPATIDVAIHVEVAPVVVAARLAGRLAGSQEQQRRRDDADDVVARRLQLYEAETAPVVGWFADQGLLATVDGLAPVEEVTARLMEVVDQALA
ncbi:MAG: adenylate kinase [Acidimicrobiales bacterium]